MSVSRPVTSQTRSNQPGAPTCRAMIEETIKMPEPIIDPATSMVESSKPALLGVDSGAPISAIALKRRAHFGLTGIPGSSTLPARLQINGAFNNVAIAHNFRLGALNLVDEPVVVVDLSGSGRASRLLHE